MALNLALAGCSVFGIRSGTESPSYAVIDHVGPVEIRQYGPQLVASTVVQGDEISARSTGFRRLAGYIFGENISMTAPVVESKIAMTAPVVQSPSPNGGWTITFTMPRKYTLQTLPKPKQAGIEIHQLSAATDAVYRFSGIPGIAAVNSARDVLLSQLSGSAWKVTGDPVTWFYDPPWTLPWCRRNEVAVAVAPRAP